MTTTTDRRPMELDPAQHSPEELAIRRPEVERLSFAEELAGWARGTLNDEATAALYELVEAVQTLDKAGKLTLVIDVAPAGSGRRSVTVAGQVTAKPPRPEPEPSFRFVGDGGSLHKDDPYAGRIPGVPYRDADGEVKVTQEDGTVHRLVIEEPALPTPITEENDQP